MVENQNERDRAPYPHHEHWSHESRPRTPWYRRPRVWFAMGVACLLFVIVVVSVGALADGDDDTSSTATPTTARTTDSDPATRIGKRATATKLPKEVRLSGSAGDLELVGFRTRTIAENFAPILRVRNTSKSDVSFVIVKVTVMSKGEPVATANSIIETIRAGQTITNEPLSSDEWTKRSTYTYDVQLDDE